MKRFKSLQISWILLVYYLSFIVGQSQDNKQVYLYANRGAENVPKCGDAFLQDIDTYVVRGKVNSSQIDLRTITIDLIYPTEKIHECLFIFPDECKQKDNPRACSCTPTDNSDIFDIKLSMPLKLKQSLAKVKASLSIYNKDNVNSEEISLPEVYDLNSLKLNYELKINNKQMDINNCNPRVSNRRVNLEYSVSSEPEVSNQLVLEYNTTKHFFPEDTVGHFNLQKLEYIDDGAEEEIHFAFYYFYTCGKEMKTFNCSFTFAQGTETKSHSLFIVIAVGLPVATFIVLIGIIFCLRKPIWNWLNKLCTKNKIDKKDNKEEPLKAAEQKESFRLIETDQEKAMTVID